MTPSAKAVDALKAARSAMFCLGEHHSAMAVQCVKMIDAALVEAALAAAVVGTRIRFAEERQAYTVQARGPRYLVCNKPFNARRTTLYTVVDLVEGVRGTENLIFGAGAETRKQCEAMLARLEGRSDPTLQTEVSYRNRIPLRVEAVMEPRA